MLFNSFKAAVTAYGIKFLLTLVFSLKKILASKNKLATLLEVFKDKSSISFALFMGSFVAIFRSIVCGLRRKVSNRRDKYLFMLGGLVGGTLSVAFL